MTLPRSEPFKAAVRAGCSFVDMHLSCSYPECACKVIPRAIEAALHRLLPPDPAPETLEAIYREINLRPYDVSVESAAYRALRASLLPGEEPS